MFSDRTSWNLSANALTRALDAHRAKERPLLDLTASNPTQVGLQYNQREILNSLADPASLTYHPEPKGILTARKAVAEYYASRQREITQLPDYSITQFAERIVLTVSTSEAYTFVFRLLCNPGDEVLIPAPSYPLFEFLAGLQDVRLTPYSLLYDHGWQIDFHSLQTAITRRSRAIILVHPNNPTGSFVLPSEQRELNDLCTQHELALVADEVFLDYSYGDVPFSFTQNQEALTFTLSGISKIAALPQMKLAWIVISGPELAACAAMSRLEVMADTYLSPNAPVQMAAPVLLQQRHSIRRQLMGRICLNLTELDRQLAGQKLVSRLEVRGGWYAILRVPAIRSDEDFAIALLEHQDVLIQPGYFYDFPADGYLVLSLITPEVEFREGIKRVLEFVIGNL